MSFTLKSKKGSKQSVKIPYLYIMSINLNKEQVTYLLSALRISKNETGLQEYDENFSFHQELVGKLQTYKQEINNSDE